MEDIKKKSLRSTVGRKVSDIISRRSSKSIIFIYNAITISIIAAFYPIIPILLNYAPNNEEVSAKLGTSNIGQYVVMTLFTVIVGTVFLSFFFKGIDKWKVLNAYNEADKEKIKEIRKKCINLPYIIFLLQILITMIPLSLLLFTVATLNQITYLAPAKIILMVTSFFSLAAVISHTFAKEIFKKILVNTYIGQEKEGVRISLRRKIFLQVMPILIIAILFTALIGYSRLIEEKGDLIYNIFRTQLHEKIAGISNMDDMNDAFQIVQDIKLEKTNCYYFVKTPDGVIKASDGSFMGGYLTYFIDNPYNGDRLYDINAEVQGVVSDIKTASGNWKIGIIFNVASSNALNFFLVGFALILILNTFVLYYFSKSLSDDISLVAESLMEIAAGANVDLDKKIPVTSNDEIGDLVVAFNKVQEKEKEHIREIEEKHEIMMEQERMASLGQLMGGIAHNLRSPIMSLSGAMEGLKDLINEYRSSIGDTDVTMEDHQEIAGEMLEWIEKMKPHCTYMADIITAIRDQTLQPSSDSFLSFTLDDLSKRVDILMSHELKRYHCKLKTDFQADMNTQIKGELSAMVQILNNLIINAIEAYEGKGGEIDLQVAVQDKKVVLMVKDYAKGIPDDVKDRIFKEMITTKGKSGTGLGLYMSYSNLKARFGGKMWFESEEGKGTEFYISVPIKE